MRSPILIAETPFAHDLGARFLAPPGREVDADVTSYYIGRVRETEEDVEEVEGDDYLAVRLPLRNERTGETAPEIMVLAGIDVDRMSSQERDEVLEQLRERLEVLNDAVAAIDWQLHEHDMVVEIPELEEWHEPSWDALPRTGPWADPEAVEQPAANTDTDAHADASRSVNEDDIQADADVGARSVSEDENEHWSAAAESDNAAADNPWSDLNEHVEDHSTPASVFEDMNLDQAETPVEPEPEPVAAAPIPEPAPPKIIVEMPLPAAVKEPPAPAGPVTVIVQVVADSHSITPAEPDPKPDVIVPSKEPAPAPLPAITPPPTSLLGVMDPIPVSSSADRSATLTEPPKPAVGAGIETEKRRRFRWYVWFPWTAVVVLLVAKYLYLTQLDRTWNQRIEDVSFASGPTKVVEVPVDRVVEKRIEVPVEVEKIVKVPVEVEKIVKVPVPAAATDNAKLDQWAKFEAEYKARASRGELTVAADLLTAWQKYLPAWGLETPPGLAGLKTDFTTAAGKRLDEWAVARAKERRFADAYAGLSAFAGSESAKGLLGAAVAPELAARARGDVRSMEDEYHYTQIRTLSTEPGADERLKQHINAYLSLVEPPGRMLAEVQQLAEYRAWLKDGQAKATVKIEWGPRVQSREYQIEIGLGRDKSGEPLKSFTRTAFASTGRTWSETFPLTGIAAGEGKIPYRIKTIRPTSPVEELAESLKQRTELFMIDPLGPLSVADETESGTKVSVEWQGVPAKPNLPAWGEVKSSVLPVSVK